MAKVNGYLKCCGFLLIILTVVKCFLLSTYYFPISNYDFSMKERRLPLKGCGSESLKIRLENEGIIEKIKKCRSLFSIESATSVDTFKNKFLSRTARGESSYSPIDKSLELFKHISTTTDIIRCYKESDPEHLFTETYLPLLTSLPRAVTFELLNTPVGRVKHDKPGQYLGKIPQIRQAYQSRIVEETLPFVPCSIKSYDDNSQVFSCLQKQLERKDSLTVHFLGDSKIRNLLHQFLDRTDDIFNFMVKMENRTRTWIKSRYDLMTGEKWTDFVATSATLPGLRVILSFRKFMDDPSNIEDSNEFQQLKKWANSEEPPPDLLITGYAEWALTHFDNVWQSTPTKHTIAVMDIIMELHENFVPLLAKIAEKTRVLVLPQSRIREHAKKLFPNNRAAVAVSNVDWTESTFLYFLNRQRQTLSQEHVQTFGKETLKRKDIARVSKKHQVSWFTPNFENIFKENVKNQNNADQTPMRDDSSPIVNNSSYGKTERHPRPSNKVQNNSSTGVNKRKSNQSYKNNQALKDMHQFISKKQSLSISKEEHSFISGNQYGFRDYLTPVLGDSELWWWDAILPLNLAEIEECQEMYRKNFTMDPLYKGTDLKCLDPTHAGNLTLRDLTTMMLNLLCNAVLEAEGDYCCT